MTKRVEVRIQGHAFTVKTMAGEEYVRKVEAHVERVMNGFRGRARGPDSHKAAVLTAFKLADDYFQLKEEIDGRDKETRERVTGLIQASDLLIDGLPGESAG